MLLAVFSDSHGDVEPMRWAVEEYRPDVVLHLGDHARDAEELCALFPRLDIRYVRGNCDFGSDASEELCFTLDGVTIYMTHGHKNYVKYSLDSLGNAAYFSGARLALFGHTHRREYKEMGALTLFNPGAAGEGGRSGALIRIEGGSFQCEWKEL